MAHLNIVRQDIHVHNLSIFTPHIERDLNRCPLQNDLIILLLYAQVLSLDGRSIWTVLLLLLLTELITMLYTVQQGVPYCRDITGFHDSSLNVILLR
jgi:hypothetical protein